MTKSAILITGASGQLGWRLCRFFCEAGYAVHGVFHTRRPPLPGVRLIQCDLADQSRRDALDLHGYRAVIHAAAIGHPDICEKAPDLARRTNVEATAFLAERLPVDCRLIFISTDLVFDGLKGCYIESDPPAAINKYAATKIEAEEAVKTRAGSVIVRMALLYGPPAAFPGGFTAWMRGRLEAGQEVPLYTDQFRTPVYAGDVAQALRLLIEKEPRSSVYHVGGAERVSRWEFGQKYVQVFGYDPRLLRPTKSQTAGEPDAGKPGPGEPVAGKPVARGQDCSLDSGRFAREFGFRPGSVLDGLQRMKESVY